MYLEGDFIEFGSLIALEDGWFLEKETLIKYKMMEDGSLVGENGEIIPFDDDTADER